MNPHQQQIRQMRADVDKLAAKPEPDLHTTLLDHARLLKLRMRRLHVGERVTRADLWLDSQGQLHPVRDLAWWCFGFGYKIRPDNAEHYRVL